MTAHLAPDDPSTASTSGTSATGRPVPDEPSIAATPDGDAAPAAPLPPDPVAFDTPRNEMARRRGLPQPYIAGGDDPQLPETLRRERRYVRLLIAMVVFIVALGFVLGLAAALITAPPA